MVRDTIEKRAAGARRRGLAAAVAVLLLVLGCTADDPAAEPAGSPTVAAGTGATGASAFDAATRDDDAFNRQFTHEFAVVDDVRMHYVTGGTGPPLVLLHGWPQSWYEWRGIMPELAEQYTVYALDLPGLGDSQGTPSGYDKATLARYVHGLVADELGLREINLVAHDLGAGVGFQYAARYPDEVTRYAHLDYSLPGPGLSADELRTYSWHLAFHEQQQIPEAVVGDDVRRYLALFYPQVAYRGVSFGGNRTDSPFTDAQIDEFARTYSRPQVLRGGFELYRTLDEDERDNTAAEPIDVPTMLMTAEGTLATIRAQTEPRMANVVRAVEVPRSGHWLPEENPRFVTRELLAFLSGS